MALPDLTGINIQDSYQRVLHTDGTNVYNGTGSLFIIQSASYAATASHANDFFISGDLQSLGNITSNSTGSFRHLKASKIEGNSPLVIAGVTEITFDNTDLFGNPIFHGDVNVYNASAFLDEADNLIFRSEANDQSGTGNIQFGSSAAGTLIQGNRIILDGPITASTPFLFDIPGGDGGIRIGNDWGDYQTINWRSNNVGFTLGAGGSLIARVGATGPGGFRIGNITNNQGTTYTLDVSGTTRLSDDVTITGSVDINGSTIITGSFKVTGSFTAQLPTSSNDTYFLTYNTSSYQLEAREVATLINPKVEYLDLTASIASGTSITLPNGLSYISSSVYEYLEVFFNGLRLRYDRDFIPTSTTTIQTQLAFPVGSELTFKSLKA